MKKNIEKKLDTIQAKSWYNLTEVCKLGRNRLFPFVSIDTVRKFIKSGDLRSVKRGTKKLPRYRIKGEWILDFLEKFEEGKIPR